MIIVPAIDAVCDNDVDVLFGDVAVVDEIAPTFINDTAFVIHQPPLLPELEIATALDEPVPAPAR
ncbi:hypothetical protein [Mycobacteroides immunogenum]|nr:hypothetical protein [Mycobacteroides immunogenum]